MFIYIGFSTDDKVIFVLKKFLNKLDFGVYLELNNKEKFDLYENETNLIDYDFKDFEIINHYNAHLFLNFEKNINKLTLVIYNFFQSVHVNIIKHDELMRKHFTECFNSLELIHSTFEICILIIASICLDITPSSKFCFNLPGGAGKTHAIDWLGNLFKNKILITTPTAKASIHYKLNNVKTNHSTFKLNHHNMNLSWVFYQEPVFIFDEASMISQEVINSLKLVAKQKKIFLIGDFAQLGPVLAKSIIDLQDLRIINAAEDLYLPRFKCNDLVRFLTLIRKRILDPTFLIDRGEILTLISKFPKENNQNVYDKFLANSEFDFITNTAKIKKFLSCKTICNHFKTETVKEIDLNVDSFFPMITSKNKSVKLMNDDINKQLSGYSSICCLPASFYIRKKSYENREFMHKLTRHLFNPKLLHIGNNLNTIIVGSRVLCRNNETKSHIYNGLSGIVVGVFQNHLKVVKNIIISKKRKKNVQINKKICVYEGDLELLLFIYYTTFKKIYEMKTNSEIIVDNHSFKTFYIQPNYCVTLHQLQGHTIDSGRIYSLDDVLSRNILSSFYVLVSRGKCFNDVVLSDKIIDRLMCKLFG